MKELKKILLFVLIFSSGFFIADRILGFVLGKMFAENYSGQSGGKINYYLRKNYNPKLLIMGDSRALNQVNPDSFKISAYNISHAGMDEIFQEALLDLIIQKEKKPEIILLHLDPTFFIAKKDDGTVQNKAIYLKPFYGQAPLLTKYINDSGNSEKIKFFFSSYKYNNIIFNILKNKIRKGPAATNGFEAIAVTDFDAERTKITAAKDTIPDSTRPDPARLSHLVSIMNACKKNGIRLICYTSPVWQEKNISPLEKTGALIDSVCKKNNVVYLDYSSSKERKSEFGNINLWYDCFHLNAKGAAVFSSIISGAVDSLVSAPNSMR